jgi:hypothetical protein
LLQAAVESLVAHGVFPVPWMVRLDRQLADAVPWVCSM